MQIERNPQTYADFGTAISKIPPAAQELFNQFHKEVSKWVASAKASVTCAAHVKGVTYSKSKRAFIWVNFGQKGFSVLIPNLKADAFEGVVPSTDIPGGYKGIRIAVKNSASFQIALKAFQEAYPLF